jgi:hypothetical protein
MTEKKGHRKGAFFDAVASAPNAVRSRRLSES